MRILRIALRNFRGVTFREVRIPSEGVTVIEGPNEVGKSSLAEAIDLLFDFPDHSADQRVRAVQRVDADLGAEVEAELTVGPYHLAYRKRWHKQPETTLRVLAPGHEQLSGRQAHDRVKAILGESIDPALWKALRYQQGVGIAQAALGDSPSLLTALDAAAAGKGDGGEGEAEDLWSKVGKERERYFTAGGKANAARTRLDGQVEAGRGEVARLTRELNELEVAAEEHRRLRLELAQLTVRRADQEKIVQERGAEWGRLQEQQQEVERLAVEAERAVNLAEKAGAAQQERLGLIEQLRLAGETRAELAERAQREAPGLEAAAAAVAEARGRREEARGAHRSAEQGELLARRDLDYFRELFNLEMLAERWGRVEEAERQQAEAQAFLEHCRIDPAKLEEIEQAFLAVATARAGLRAESASVRVEALGPTELEVDGEERSLAAGEVVEAAVAGSLEIVLPGQVRVTVTGGARTLEAEQQVVDAEERLQGLFAAAGVSGDGALAKARELERGRRSAELTAEQAAKALQENLRDLTPQVLAEKIEHARSRIEGHQAERPAGPPMPASREDAQAASEQAATHLRLAKEATEQRDRELELAEEALRQVQNASVEREIRAQAAEEAVQAREKELAEKRGTADDAQLASALVDAGKAADAAGAAHRTAAEGLKAHNPEEVSALLENARAVLINMEQSRREAELELSGVKRLLDFKGETGLHDQLDLAQSKLLLVEREKEHTDRRAQAADLLYRTLGKHRDAAKRAYVAPFREQLEGFGRIVFGGDFSIELDHEDLRVVNRTLGGVTVPYESLSMGAKEQLSLIARLACAVLVSRPEAADGGVPVIIDDALGNSDPARLERLGAILSLAGRQVQVIVLTCTPDRYRNVGSATVIKLTADDGAEGGEPPAPGPALPGRAAEGKGISAEAEGEGSSPASRVLACLRAAGGPLGKSEIVARSGLPESAWQATIASLLALGQVTREGERRGTRYRASPR